MGKGGELSAYDFLLSIDYAWCHGPVDRVNQLWVKDEKIFCGAVQDREDLTIDLPDLFGGQDGEGGVKGVAEVYLGSSSQVSSLALASRFGLTPETMPGYRDLCHIFFRGLGTARRGWRWTSNNPYLPATKASLTRTPSTAAATYKDIYPPILDANGQLAADPEAPGAIDTTAPVAYLPARRISIVSGAVNTFPADDYKYPWAKLDFTHLSEPEIAALVGQGDGIPRVRIAIDWMGGNNGSPVNFDMQVRFREYDRAGTLLNTFDRTRSQASVIDEIVALNPLTRKVTASAIFQNTGSPTVNQTLSGAANFEVFFTSEPMPKASPAAAFWDAGSGNTEQDNATRVYLPQFFDLDIIDAGLVSLVMETTQAAQVNTGNPETFTGACHIKAYKDNGTGTAPDFNQRVTITDTVTDAAFSSFGNGGTGAVTAVSNALRIEPGARWLTIYSENARLLTLFSWWTARRSTAFLMGPGKVTFVPDYHCNIDGTLGSLPDANPALIIHECMVNTVWGKGEDPALIDNASFEAAAQTLYNEFFGLSILWVQQEKVETFIQEILDHIQAFLFQHPATGLWTLKLLRDDYDVATLPVFDETNSVASNRKRRAWGETVNEIVVSYTDPQTEKALTVSSHNLANIQIQGGVVSETRDYYGVRNALLAKFIADRDVREAGYPLFGCELEVNRRAWDLTPGSVIKLSWPEDGLAEVVCRVMEVDYGRPQDRTIKLKIVEDVFALERTTYVAPQGSLWSSTKIAPEPLVYEMAMTAPLPALLRAGQALDTIDAAPSSNGVMLMGDHDTLAILDIQVQGDKPQANGSTAVAVLATISRTPSGSLASPMVPEATSTLDQATVDEATDYSAASGDLLVLGVSEGLSEIVMLDSFAGGLWTVYRGVWDTIPLAWSAGTRVWSLPTGTSRMDPTERSEAETVTYKFLPRMDGGRLPSASAAAVAITVTDRAHAPFRPADTKLDGFGFEGLDYSASLPLPATVTATWAGRNRTTEDTIFQRWDAAPVSVETSQTVTLRIENLAGTVVEEIIGLTGGSHAIPIASLEAPGAGYVAFHAERGGIESWAANRVWFNVGIGYGMQYGLDYGLGTA